MSSYCHFVVRWSVSISAFGSHVSCGFLWSWVAFDQGITWNWEVMNACAGGTSVQCLCCHVHFLFQFHSWVPKGMKNGPESSDSANPMNGLRPGLLLRVFIVLLTEKKPRCFLKLYEILLTVFEEKYESKAEKIFIHFSAFRGLVIVFLTCF